MRRVLLSFLGLGGYEYCCYMYKGRSSTYTRFVQTAIYEHMKGEEPLHMIIFVTKEAIENNWGDSVDKYGNSIEGLETTLQRIIPEADVKLVEISSAQDEAANWELFDVILDQIEEGDQIYFDMTHSFRTIPFVSLIVLNYARLIKKAAIKKLLYGWFDRGEIVDLTNMLVLLDWTNGVDQFMRTGDASLIRQLTNEEAGRVFREHSPSEDERKSTIALQNLANQLDFVSQSFQTCRSLMISKDINKLKDCITEAKNVQSNYIKPLGPLLSEIESKYSLFGDDDLINGLLAAKWCEEHRLIQPGLTMLQENCLTAICKAFDVDASNVKTRLNLSSAIKLLLDRTPEERWRVSEDFKPFVRKMIANLEPYRELLKPFDTVSQIRNDINHAGTSTKARRADKFYTQLQKSVKDLKPLLEKMSELAKQPV